MAEIINDTATYRWKVQSEKTVIVPEAQYNLHLTGDGYASMINYAVPTTLSTAEVKQMCTSGTVITIEFNGVSYRCAGKYVQTDMAEAWYFGNQYWIAGWDYIDEPENTGEPFALFYDGLGVAWNLWCSPDIVSCTISAYIEGEGQTLVSIGKNSNPLTTLSGGIVNGLFENARYQLATPFKLLHNKDWAVEWRMSGDVTNDSALAKIWAVKNDRSSDGIVFRKTTKSISFAEQKNTHYYYGVKLNEYGIECTAEHLYRLQNKVNEDGTNMVYLYVDGKEIAPMTHTFSNNGDDGNTNYVVGKDFSYAYMGVERYIMTGFIMDDIAVWESGASEVFPEEPELSRAQLRVLWNLFSPGVFKAITGKTHWLA
jgi:hypothetical protein